MTGDPDRVTADARALLSPAEKVSTAAAAEIARAASVIADRLQSGGRLLTFGAGHSWAIAAELCHRAGGLSAVTLMSLDDVVGPRRPQALQLSDSGPERDPENGRALAEHYRLGPRDSLIIASNSGRNGAIVELALQARSRQVFLCGIGSAQHAGGFPSRHPSGATLPELSDVMLDNGGRPGDAGIEVRPGVLIGSTSTISGALLAQLLATEITRCLLDAGVEPDLLVSANIDPRPSS